MPPQIPPKKIQPTGSKQAITIADQGVLATNAECIVNAAANTKGFAPDPKKPGGGWGGIAKAIFGAVQLGEKVKGGKGQAKNFAEDWSKHWTESVDDLTGQARFVTDDKGNPATFKLATSDDDGNVTLRGEKKIIHAVAVDNHDHPYQPLDPGNKEKLKNAYLNALKAAKDKGVKSIAIPPLGIGVFKVLPEESAQCAAEAIKDFNKAFPDNNLNITMLVQGMQSDDSIRECIKGTSTPKNPDFLADRFQLALRANLAEDIEEKTNVQQLLQSIHKKLGIKLPTSSAPADVEPNPESDNPSPASPKKGLLDQMAQETCFFPSINIKNLNEIFSDTSVFTEGLKVTQNDGSVNIQGDKAQNLAVIEKNSATFPPQATQKGDEGTFTDQQAKIAVKLIEMSLNKSNPKPTEEKPLIIDASNFDEAALKKLVEACQKNQPPLENVKLCDKNNNKEYDLSPKKPSESAKMEEGATLTVTSPKKLGT